MKIIRGLTFAAVLSLAAACSDEEKTAANDAAAPADGSIADTAATAADGAASDAGAKDDAAPGDGNSAADVAASEGGLTGDAGGDGPFAASTGAWTVFGDGGASPAKDIMGSAAAYALDGGKTRVTLMVTGLAPNTTYGAHVHKRGCDDMMAGGHYQNNPSTSDAGPGDPAFANAANEVWLDFTTDAAGKGQSERIVDFRVRPGEAKAIVVHAMMTGAGGAAGPKLACLNIAF